MDGRKSVWDEPSPPHSPVGAGLPVALVGGEIDGESSQHAPAHEDLYQETPKGDSVRPIRGERLAHPPTGRQRAGWSLVEFNQGSIRLSASSAMATELTRTTLLTIRSPNYRRTLRTENYVGVPAVDSRPGSEADAWPSEHSETRGYLMKGLWHYWTDDDESVDARYFR